MKKSLKQERAEFRRLIDASSREVLVALLIEHREWMYKAREVFDELARILEPYRRPEAFEPGPREPYRPDWMEEKEES